MQQRIIAVDFDGTLCKNEWPEIGEENKIVISELLEAQAEGAAIILWTCREGDLLDKAVKWCYDRGIEFDAINENLPRMIEKWGTNPRKLGATEFWDDRAVRKVFYEPHTVLAYTGERYNSYTGLWEPQYRCGHCAKTVMPLQSKLFANCKRPDRCPHCGTLFTK